MQRATLEPPATRSPAGRVGRAWRASGRCVRLATGAAATVACLTATSGRVPVGAGLAVAVLVTAALVDIHERRLPNKIIAFGFGVVVAVGLIESLVGDPMRVQSVVGGAAVVALPLFGLHLLSPASMGFGDVKLGVAVGTVVGSIDWTLGLWVLVLASGGSAAVALALRRRTIAFGPGLVGATVTLLALTAVSPDVTAVLT